MFSLEWTLDQGLFHALQYGEREWLSRTGHRDHDEATFESSSGSHLPRKPRAMWFCTEAHATSGGVGFLHVIDEQ